MKEFKIKEDLLQALTNYLVSKPFQEVAALVDAVSKLEQVK